MTTLFLTTGLMGSVVLRADTSFRAADAAKAIFGWHFGPFYAVPASRDQLQQQIRDNRRFLDADGSEIGLAETCALAGVRIPRAVYGLATRVQVASQFYREGVLTTGQSNAVRARAYEAYLAAAGFFVFAADQCRGFVDGIDGDRACRWLSDVLFRMPWGKKPESCISYLARKLRRSA